MGTEGKLMLMATEEGHLVGYGLNSKQQVSVTNACRCF